MGLRRKARECTLQILFQIEVSGYSIEECLNLYWQSYRFSNQVQSFTKILVEGSYRYLTVIDDTLKKYSRNWDIKRMSNIDRNIMRLAIFELLYLDEIPAKVTINEAVELAKRYSTEESGNFVNGILDQIIKKEKLNK